MAKYQDWITEEGRVKLEGWARSLTDADIAKNIGITQKTLIEWKKKHPKIEAALKVGRDVVDTQVENALLKRALGYEVTEYIVDESGKKKAVKKQIAPDVTAIIFWLKNRRPREWRDKRDVAVEGALKTNPFEKLTTEELRKLANSDE